jgi:hypothetical protein
MFVEHLQRQLEAPRVTVTQAAYKQSKVSGCYRDFWAAGEVADSLGERRAGNSAARRSRVE